MASDPTDTLASLRRRRLLGGMAALPALGLLPRGAVAAPATSAVNTTGLAVTDD